VTSTAFENRLQVQVGGDDPEMSDPLNMKWVNETFLNMESAGRDGETESCIQLGPMISKRSNCCYRYLEMGGCPHHCLVQDFFGQSGHVGIYPPPAGLA
jgi:hypothetical protein